MRSFLLFLYKYRASLVFILLESAAFFLVVQNSNYNRAQFFNSTNYVVGSLLETSNNINSYFSLITTNQQLSKENALLRAKYLALLEKLEEDNTIDTVSNFSFINSKIVNNSVYLLNNTLTINTGSSQGVQLGMGVIGNSGIVGKVKRVGKTYSTVVSILDVDVKISAEIKNKINLCTVQWDGKSPEYTKVLYVPRHYDLAIGDTVTTSGFNAIYPSGITIGIISKLVLPEDASFFDVQIKLVNNFTSLSLVEVVLNKDLPQIDSLTQTVEE
ncbi:MAG: rod shape-determining protein MreC [Cyclobacteriaceae bacterium]|nr:rod shape-determining protein MreC [Cyclobacteriaceae bacterium]